MMATRSRHRFSRGSSEGRKYSRSDSEKRKRLRLIPEWLERNADLMSQPQPPNSVYDQEAFQELIQNVLDGNIVAVNLLADAGVNVNMQDSRGWTPLHHAVAEGQNEMAEVLIKKGALKSRRNKDGLAPYELPVKFNSEKVDDGDDKLEKEPRIQSRPQTSHKTIRDNFSGGSQEYSTFFNPRSKRKERARLESGHLSISKREIPHLQTMDHFSRPMFNLDISNHRSQPSQLPRVFGTHRVFEEELPGFHHRGQIMTRHASFKSPDGMNYGAQSESFSSYQMFSTRKF